MVDWLFELGMPRLSCFPWDPYALSVYAGSAVGTFLAYVYIGGSVLRFHLIVREIVHARAVIAYGLFIVVCGVDHILEDVFALKFAAYRLFAVWKLVMFIVSAYAAFVTPHVIMDVFFHVKRTRPDDDQHPEAVSQLSRVEAETKILRAVLEDRLSQDHGPEGSVGPER